MCLLLCNQDKKITFPVAFLIFNVQMVDILYCDLTVRNKYFVFTLWIKSFVRVLFYWNPHGGSLSHEKPEDS